MPQHVKFYIEQKSFYEFAMANFNSNKEAACVHACMHFSVCSPKPAKTFLGDFGIFQQMLMFAIDKIEN